MIFSPLKRVLTGSYLTKKSVLLCFLIVFIGRRTEGKCQRFEKKGGKFGTQKVSVFIEIGVFFSLKISEKGAFFKSENADTSSLS